MTVPRHPNGPHVITGWGRRGALLALVASLLVVTGCSSSGSSSATPEASVSTSAAPSVKDPQVSVDGGTTVSYRTPVTLNVADGAFTSVQVTDAEGVALEGDVAPGGASWASQEPPTPGLAYQVRATVKDASEQELSKEATFTVAAVPDDKRIAFSVTPDDGETVGIGQPVVIRFTTAISERAAVEKAMQVTASATGGAAVTGAWHWLNDREVHWRPKEFWTPGTKVTLEMKIAGVKASATRWGRKDYSETFTIGASHVTRVDAAKHRTQVYRDGKLVDTWKSGTGKRGLETYSGTYIVLGKAKEIQMDSCSARITCDKKDPDYYDEKEYWATRVTASGTFLHAASWDGLLGRANVSHGCVHLSDADAKTFYENAVIGDVVIVNNSGRGPEERIATQDPGLYDWNLSWAKWQAGSALA